MGAAARKAVSRAVRYAAGRLVWLLGEDEQIRPGLVGEVAAAGLRHEFPTNAAGLVGGASLCLLLRFIRRDLCLEFVFQLLHRFHIASLARHLDSTVTFVARLIIAFVGEQGHGQRSTIAV